MDVNETIRDIKSQLRSSMNGAVSQSMREKGLGYKLNFGVEIPRIKLIASQYDKNHDLAQLLWKEDIRESKILATHLQPYDSFYPEIADIWVENIHTMEIAEQAAMNLFQYLMYAPAKSFQWIADEREFFQVAGYLTISRLLQKKGDMNERASAEFLDQALAAVNSEFYNIRQSAIRAIRVFTNHSESNAFLVCRLIEGFEQSAKNSEREIYSIIKEEVENAGFSPGTETGF